LAWGSQIKKGIINLSWAKFPAACCDKSELNSKNMILHGLPRRDFIYFGNKKIGGIANSENPICVFKKDMGYVKVDQRARYRLTLKVFDITDFPSHAISISGPSRNFTDEKVAQIVKDLTLLCKSLSEELSTINT
jgi:hypothetical protein